MAKGIRSYNGFDGRYIHQDDLVESSQEIAAASNNPIFDLYAPAVIEYIASLGKSKEAAS
jgi:hypothetical protein